MGARVRVLHWVHLIAVFFHIARYPRIEALLHLQMPEIVHVDTSWIYPTIAMN